MPCYVSGLLAVTDADVAPKKTVCKVLMPTEINEIIRAQAHVYTNEAFSIHQPTINAQHSMIARCAVGAAGELIFDVLRCSTPLAKPAARMPAEIFITGEIASCSSDKLLLKASEYVANSSYEFKVLINFNDRMKKRYANFTPYLRTGNIINVTAQLLKIHEHDRIMELTDADLNLVNGLRKKEIAAPSVDLTGKEWWQLKQNDDAAQSKSYFDEEITVVERTIATGNIVTTSNFDVNTNHQQNDESSDDDEPMLAPKRRKLRGG